LTGMVKLSVAALLIIGLTPSAYSQKLSNVQEGSVRAPANIRVDAKLNEWDDTFKAYNRTTDLYYTISNDDKNLYFAIKSTVPTVNSKIIAGGMNFTINTDNKKKDREKDKDKSAYVIVFPLIDMSAMRNQMMQRMGGGGGGGAMAGRSMGGGVVAFGAPGGAMPNQGQMDSIGLVMRKEALKSIKEVKLLGFAETDIPDTVISIYNEYGVKTAIDYDKNGNLTCEMAIPLKYLHLSTDNPKEFAYNIKLNGLNLSSMLPPGVNMSFGTPDMAGGGGGGMAVTVTRGGGGGMGGGGDMVMSAPRGMPSMGDMQSMISPTDFWGKYTLAKK